MHHAVSYGINLVEALDHANLRIGEQREDELHAFRMLRNVMHDLTFLTVGELHLDEGPFESHTLGAAAGHHTLVVHVVQCVLDTGRTTI